jgi:hypothetical protein
MTGETPVPGTLADITAASIEHNSLSPREFMLARMAALIAVDAPPAPCLAKRRAAADSGVTAGDIEGGDDRGRSGGGLGAGGLGGREDPPGLGFAIAVADSDMAEDDDAGQ